MSSAKPPWPSWLRSVLIAACIATMALGPPLVLSLLGPLIEDRAAIRPVVTVAVAGGAAIALVAVVLLHVRRTARFIDAALEATGLQATAYLFRGRRARGEVAGRDVQATWLPAQQLRPGTLELSVTCKVKTRFGATTRPPPARPSGRSAEDLTVSGSRLEGLWVTAADPRWGKALLAAASAEERLATAVCAKHGEHRWFRFAPGVVQVRTAGLPTERVTPELFVPLIEAMVELAEIAERLPAARTSGDSEGAASRT